MEDFRKDYENLFNRLKRQEGLKDGPAADYDFFLAAATDVFVKKDTDYDSRFLRGMIAGDGWTLWAWEVNKKIDRLRSWLKRGELQVKGEGIVNSVIDLFNYTVQYVVYVQHTVNHAMTEQEFLIYWKLKREALFFEQAAMLKPAEWVGWLVDKGRIAPEEVVLQNLIRLYMGEKLTPEDWKQAIKKIINRG